MFGLRRGQPTSLTYIGANSEFQGNLHVEGNLRVEGIIHGTVEVRGDIEIASTGLIEGPEIRASNIMIHGVVKAHIIAEGKLTLSRTGRLEGDVAALALDIEPGAFYLGHIETRDPQALPGAADRPQLPGRS